MKKKAIIILFITLGLGLLVFLFSRMPNGFDPEYDHAEIKQNIGGALIADSVYNADIHDWEYDVTYKYQSLDNKIYNIGVGTFVGRDWEKNEQLIKDGDWIILKTGSAMDDKIIVGNLTLNKWTSYEIYPQVIEKEPMWIQQHINSSPDYADSIARIKNIDTNGQLTVLYTYAIKNRIFSFMTGKKLIKYQINIATGVPEMKEIVSP